MPEEAPGSLLHVFAKHAAGTDSVSQTPLTDRKSGSLAMDFSGVHLENDHARHTGAPIFRVVSTCFGRWFSLLQTFRQNRGKKLFYDAVIPDFGRLLLVQLQVYLDAVALIGTDQVARFIERESFLVVHVGAFDQFIVTAGKPILMLAASKHSSQVQEALALRESVSSFSSALPVSEVLEKELSRRRKESFAVSQPGPDRRQLFLPFSDN